jgi:peptidoglycan/LPS O-acetylase OafA/YrhL
MGLFRVLLALSVVMSHFIKWDAPFYRGFGGTTSVEIFFLVSGFYIALILDQSYKSKKLFYINRILRLYPIYLIVCFVVLVVSLFRTGVAENLFDYSPLVLSVSTFSNLTLIGTDWLMFFDTANGGIHFTSSVLSGDRMRDLLWVPPAWSLGIEITFYAFAPLLCKLRSRFLVLSIGLIVLLKIIFHHSSLNFSDSPFDVRFFPFELPFFLVGIILYRLKRDSKSDFEISLRFLYPSLIICFVAFDFIRQELDLSRVMSMAILMAIASIIVLFGKNSEFDRKFGELSFPIYISHTLVSQIYGFVITGATKKFPILGNNAISVWTQVSAVLIVSYVLLQITKPVERLRDKNRILN